MVSMKMKKAWNEMPVPGNRLRPAPGIPGAGSGGGSQNPAPGIPGALRPRRFSAPGVFPPPEFRPWNSRPRNSGGGNRGRESQKYIKFSHIFNKIVHF